MKFLIGRTKHPRGSSLVESSVAIGVLALAVPLVFGTIAEAGKSGASSDAETRSAWIIPTCLREIEDSRNGRPRYFTSTAIGETFPPDQEVWAIAFSNEGSAVDKVTKTQYEQGIRSLNGKAIGYLAKLCASTPDDETENHGTLGLRITLEYPASAPAAKRRTLNFHSRIP